MSNENAKTERAEETEKQLVQSENSKRPMTTKEVMRGEGTRDTSTPGEGILTSQGPDHDTATD